MRICIINGPNLQAIGSRETDIYGVRTFDDFLLEMQNLYKQQTGLNLEYIQSHHEGVIIEELYRCSEQDDCIGIVLNAGAYTHTSIAILDAIRAISSPVVEVHLSNIYAREAYRHKSVLSEACLGQITGFGLESYRLAIDALLAHHTANRN